MSTLQVKLLFSYSELIDHLTVDGYAKLQYRIFQPEGPATATLCETFSLVVVGMVECGGRHDYNDTIAVIRLHYRNDSYIQAVH